MPGQHIRKDVAELNGRSNIAPAIEIGLRKPARPAGGPVIQSALDATPDKKPHGRFAMVCSPTGILPHRPAELRAGEHDHIVHQRAKIIDERANAS